MQKNNFVVVFFSPRSTATITSAVDSAVDSDGNGGSSTTVVAGVMKEEEGASMVDHCLLFIYFDLIQLFICRRMYLLACFILHNNNFDIK